MALAHTNGIQIEYETFGRPSRPVLLLIAGLSGQLIHWPEAFCEAVSERGYRVIRFDNRDTGLSTKFDEAAVPDIPKTLRALVSGEEVTPCYSLEDMADDAVGLLDALDIQRAHVCGVSMGGMIAQTMALKAPSRLLSLISIYSTTGNPELPPPTDEVMELLNAPPPADRDAYIEQAMAEYRILSGSGLPFDEDFHRKIITRAARRSFYPQGVARQIVTLLTQPNRKPDLSSVSTPTLIIHGDEDPLYPIEAGKDAADAIPGAAFLAIKGMGHDLPKMDKHWLKISDAMVDHMAKVSR